MLLSVRLTSWAIAPHTIYEAERTMPADHEISASPRTRYGIANAERVENPIWLRSIDGDWSGSMLRTHLGLELEDAQFRLDFAHSSYRQALPGPFWSWIRFGRTSTTLPDGRVIHIAGEHEDFYDPDFCIYNDVVVEHPDGRREFYLYPKEVFPPTDFHSATLVGTDIVLIGSLGYLDLRRFGETQVLRLDTATLRIEPVATTGEQPGWISRHTAQLLGDASIVVGGGTVHRSRQDKGPSQRRFALDLTTKAWRRLDDAEDGSAPIG